MQDNLLRHRIITSVLITIALVITMKPNYGQSSEVSSHNTIKNHNIVHSRAMLLGRG